MSQQEVFNYLRKNSNRWYNTTQIANNAKLPLSGVTRACRLLREHNEVLFRQKKYYRHNCTQKLYEYSYPDK